MKDLTNCKIWIGDDPELSEKVQKRLFELGYTWDNKDIIVKPYCKSVFIWKDKSLAQTSDKTYFDYKTPKYKEIVLSDLFEEDRIPKVGEIWNYSNQTYSYIIKSFHSNGAKVMLMRTDTNEIIENYDVNSFKRGVWKRIKSIEEDLSKVPYTEWKVGDVVERILHDFENIKIGDKVEITKLCTSSAFEGIPKNPSTGRWSFSNFKLVKRASQDIIKDDFVLPEKWCIKFPKDYFEIANKWMHANCSNYVGYTPDWKILYDNTFFCFPQYVQKVHSNSAKPKDYTEITIEQFKKYVLMSNNNEKIEAFQKTVNNLNKQLNKTENGNSSKESESFNESNSRRETKERSNISFGGCGDGLETSNRERKIRSVQIGERTGSEGEGLCTRRRSQRTITI